MVFTSAPGDRVESDRSRTKGTDTTGLSVLFRCGYLESTLTGVRLEVRIALLFFRQNPHGGWVCMWQMSLA